MMNWLSNRNMSYYRRIPTGFNPVHLCILLLLVVDLSSCLVSYFWGMIKKNSLKEDYDLLNKILYDVLPEDEEPSSNLIEAMNLLKMSRKELSRDKALVNLPSETALLTFSSLITLINPKEPVCDLSGLDILRRNEQALARQISMPPNQLGPLRRIDDVVYRVALIHAAICRYNYPSKLLKLLDNGNKSILKKLKKMLNTIIKVSRVRVFTHNLHRTIDPRYVLKERAKSISIKSENVPEAMFDYLLQESMDDKDKRFLSMVGDPVRRNKWIVEESKVKFLIDKYIFDKCEYEHRAFGDVLEPAAYDQGFADKEHEYKAINESNAEIMVWLQYHRLCQEILDNKNYLLKKFVTIIKTRVY